VPGFLVLPPAAASPGGILNPARVPFWGLNDDGVTPNEDLLYYPDPWDTFKINDVQLPGRCHLQNKSIAELDVEKSKGKNNSGARIRFFGYLPGAFDVVERIVTPEQWDIFQGIQDTFWAGPAKAAKPPQMTVKVSHPDLGRLRVYQAVLVGMPLAEDADMDGAKYFRWQFHENVPQRPHKAKVAGGPIPEDARLPSSQPENAKPELPSKNPANLGLDGPKLKKE
jgi:hypothetical protein